MHNKGTPREPHGEHGLDQGAVRPGVVVALPRLAAVCRPHVPPAVEAYNKHNGSQRVGFFPLRPQDQFRVLKGLSLPVPGADVNRTYTTCLRRSVLA